MAEQLERTDKKSRIREARVVLVTLAAVLLVWFVIANAQSVKIHFWVFTTNASLIAVILISAALGAIMALLLKRRHPS